MKRWCADNTLLSVAIDQLAMVSALQLQNLAIMAESGGEWAVNGGMQDRD
jgi:hypothetical protein